MDIDIRQLFLLLIAIAVPMILIWRRQSRLLGAWVCFTFFVQIFDTVILTNLPAGRIVGLLFLPNAVRTIHQWARLRPIQAWLFNYGWLVLLGLMFGFLWPWPDTTLARPFSLQAPGRTLIYLTRTLADLSLAVFLAKELARTPSLLWMGRWLVAGATLSSLAGVLQFFFNVDLYYTLTGLGEQVVFMGRSRGLVGEPRALGLACAYGSMTLLLGRRNITPYWTVLLLINLTGLLLTYSASSLVLFLAGILVVLLFFSNQERLIALAVLGFMLTVILISSILLPEQFAFAVDTLRYRFDPEVKLSGIPPGTWAQEIAYRLDVFDASALLFLIDQPLYALLGTGPGLVTLPASEHIPPGQYSSIWTAEVGINSPPYHGLLLEIANSGMLGLALWIWQVRLCLLSLRRLSAFPSLTDRRREEWVFGYALFLLGATFYLIQVSYSPVWSLFLAIGWAAVNLLEKLEASSVAPEWDLSQASSALDQERGLR
ncbi:MAG: O-antigen ligase family protein [Blastocatellia bacterium]|jgi:hypothetical protein